MIAGAALTAVALHGSAGFAGHASIADCGFKFHSIRVDRTQQAPPALRRATAIVRARIADGREESNDGMFSQEDIDAVLQDAQRAVDDLAAGVGGLATKAPPAERSAPPTAVAAPPAAPANSPRPIQQAAVDRLLQLKVPVIVRLAQRQMLVGTIMKMGPGTILEFDRMVNEELDLMINNSRIGSGVAVKVNEHFGLRITRIDSVKRRIDSLGAG